MKQEFKDIWVKALRSDEYKQTKGSLRNADGFCCLGVLCDLVKDEVGIDWAEADPWGVTYFGDMASVLPARVYILAELRTGSPKVKKPDGFKGRGSEGLDTSTLADLNDNGYTFEQIADIIEEEL